VILDNNKSIFNYVVLDKKGGRRGKRNSLGRIEKKYRFQSQRITPSGEGEGWKMGIFL